MIRLELDPSSIVVMTAAVAQENIAILSVVLLEKSVCDPELHHVEKGRDDDHYHHQLDVWVPIEQMKHRAHCAIDWMDELKQTEQYDGLADDYDGQPDA